MIGIDVIEIERIAKAMKTPGFTERIFTPAEIIYIQSKGNAPQTAAGLFAAKEAVSKALGTGFTAALSHKDIEITHDEHGAPRVTVKGAGSGLSVSISHCKTYAVAAAVIKG
jgi:holo-[acyl-carrier protein] synthase